MTTTRLYYLDSGLTAFDAVVTSCAAVGERFEVQLNRTAFYPASGGQPFDTGRLDASLVVEVVDRGDEVVHVVTAPLTPGARVDGWIDLDRRRDHMEQHTGQHLLSAVIERQAGAGTVGFHMGTEVSTIDLARELSAGELAAAETEANRIIRENRVVSVKIVPEGEVAALRLRRESSRAGDLRIVEIESCDVSACGGTHLSRTGEVGSLAIVGSEKVRGGTRLSFQCGGRAVRSFRTCLETLAEAGQRLGVAPGDIAGHIERLQETARQRERALVTLRAEVSQLRAESWRKEAETIGPWSVVLRDANLDAGELKVLAEAIVGIPGMVVVMTGTGTPVPVVMARSTDVALDAGVLVRKAAAEMGGRGGGRPQLAQGGIPAAASAIIGYARRVLSDAAAAQRPADGRV